MKTRDIILIVLSGILMFILGGLVVYQVVTPKENKEEKAPSNKVECQQSGENNDITIKFASNGINRYLSHINDKKVEFPSKEDLEIEGYSSSEIRIFNNYVINWYATMDSSSLAIYDETAKVIYKGTVHNYSKGTNTGLIIGNRISEDNDFYWEETLIDLTGNTPNIKKTKEKINLDCSVYNGVEYDSLSETEQKNYHKCCAGCK